MGRDGLLGSFEGLVLLAVARAGGDGYGMTVRREIERRTGRDVTIGAVYSTLESTAAWSRSLFTFTGGPGVEEVRGATVSWNHFDTLGVRPLLGRGFVREDAERGDAVILAHGLWVRRFGSDPDVVGRAAQVPGGTSRAAAARARGGGMPACAACSWPPKPPWPSSCSPARGSWSAR